jgi:hypothetical protein
MKLFHRVQFQTPDPLEDGLSDDIAAEQSEADAFRTLNDMSGDDLVEHWNAIVKDVEKDPDWFTFSKD